MLKNLNKKLTEKKNKKGFTLIELIIVIAIIAILAALLLPKLCAVKENSNKTADISTAKTLADAATTLYADEKITTFSADATATNAVKITGTAANDGSINGEISGYLQTKPAGKSKSNGVTGFKVALTSDGSVKVYATCTGGDKELYPNVDTDFNHK